MDCFELGLGVGIALTGLTLDDLWLECVALGDVLSVPQLVGVLLHPDGPEARHRETVKVVVNERLLDLGLAPLYV